MRTRRAYSVFNTCDNCGTEFMYELLPDCDHNDGHIHMGTLSDNTCESCHTLFHKLQEGGLQVWFSTITGQEYMTEAEMLEAESKV